MLQTERANRVFGSHLSFSSKEQQRIAQGHRTTVDIASKDGLKAQQTYISWHRIPVDVASKDGLKAQ
ncbi:hypothetical protein [Hoylesella timonensis]|uniref:hypothetical protein n=1 Tax=Hoylesella timonensis TaxID=386414 RepID=UPI002431EEE2|nr:hypothetical protein [Hoylesella timonensis]